MGATFFTLPAGFRAAQDLVVVMLVIGMMPCCTTVPIVSNSDANSALASRLANLIVP